MATSSQARKKGLASMLPEIASPAETPNLPTETHHQALTSDGSKPASKSIKPAQRSAATNGGYMALQRKETRLRDDQIDALTAATRELNRAKTSGGERITDNTLIRVAVDLLLSKSLDLHGSSENEIRTSVGL